MHLGNPETEEERHRIMIRFWRYGWLAVLVAAVSLVAAPTAPPAFACSCAQPEYDVMIAESAAVFVGTLIERSAPVGDPPESYVTVAFEVDQWIKGDFGSDVQLRTAADGAACGLEMPEGSRSGFFVYESQGWATTGLCSTMDADLVIEEAAPFGDAPMAATLSEAAAASLQLPPESTPTTTTATATTVATTPPSTAAPTTTVGVAGPSTDTTAPRSPLPWAAAALAMGAIALLGWLAVRRRKARS